MVYGGSDRQPFPTDYYIRPEIEVRADNLAEQIDCKTACKTFQIRG